MLIPLPFDWLLLSVPPSLFFLLVLSILPSAAHSPACFDYIVKLDPDFFFTNPASGGAVVVGIVFVVAMVWSLRG